MKIFDSCKTFTALNIIYTIPDKLKQKFSKKRRIAPFTWKKIFEKKLTKFSVDNTRPFFCSVCTKKLNDAEEFFCDTSAHEGMVIEEDGCGSEADCPN